MKQILLAALFASALSVSAETPTIQTPVARIVVQRSSDGTGTVNVQGKCAPGATKVEGRLVARQAGQGKDTDWQLIDPKPAEGKFQGAIKGQGGWYNLEVRAITGKGTVTVGSVERVGIGEVFLIVGHSVAQGGEVNIEGATDDRVSAVSLDEESDSFKDYKKTGNPQFLPEPVFVQASSSVKPVPFGHGPYFWAKFSDEIVRKENVPVLIYNAGFGGSTVEYWAKSSQGIPFEHSFVRSEIRMPYINVLNTFKKYAVLTGMRAMLSDHGQNDAGEKDAEVIFQNYKTFVQQARTDLGHEALAVVVNRQMPPDAPAVRIAQERMAQEPHCFKGPDYHSLTPADRPDGAHLSEAGCRAAAQLWSEALTPEFFRHSKPYLPRLSNSNP